MPPSPTDRTPAPTQDAPQVFISYNSRDHDQVAAVREQLRARGISSFLDREHLIKGLPWPEALERALTQAAAVAVFLGPHGLGRWQRREMGFALDHQVREEGTGGAFPVIPVLLPGADPTVGFLFLNTWVDLRRDLSDPHELAGIVRAIRGEDSGHRPSDSRVDVCPYRGLEVFREQDAAFFRGREAFTERLVEAVLGRNLVAVVGPSGSGKSSLVQAGLLPKLRRQRPPNPTWDAAIFTPGERPDHRLAGALLPLLEPDLGKTDQEIQATKLGKALTGGDAYLESIVERFLKETAGTDRLLLVADQFEELFTTTPADHRGSFLARLLGALERAPLTLVVTLRADFYGHVLELSRAFADRIEQGGTVNLGPMTRDELARSIREPAVQVGLHFEPGLEDQILGDVADQPGNLPLLEFALTGLWDQRQGDLMTHAAYRTSGGVTGSIATRAESEYGQLSSEQREIARRLFTRLVRAAAPEEGNQDTRRRARLAELEPGAESIVRDLTKARLLVTSSDDPSLEAAESGPKADDPTTDQQTVDASGQGPGVEIAHEALIRNWERLRGWLNQDREFLLWRQRLDQAQAQWDQVEKDPGSLLRGAVLTEAEHWLHERPEEINAAERNFIQAGLVECTREQQARERRRRNLFASMAAGLLIAVGTALFAFWQWDRAENQATLAREQTERANQQQAIAEDQAMKAHEAQLQAEERAWLLQRGTFNSQLARVSDLWRQYPDRALGLLNDPDQCLIDLRDFTWRFFYRLCKPDNVTLQGHTDGVTSIAFSPDGRSLASAGGDGIRLWDVETGQLRATLQGHTNGVDFVDFASDGLSLASASYDGTIKLWDVETGQLHATLYGHTDGVISVAFAPDGLSLASAGWDRTVRLWDAETGQLRASFQGHTRPVLSMDFAPDGRILASASSDGTIKLWGVETGQEHATLRGHIEGVRSVAFALDGRTLASGGVDETIRLWDIETGRTRIILQGHTGTVISMAFDPDGHILASASHDDTVRLWDTKTGQLHSTLQGHTDTVDSVALAPDGLNLASASLDGTIKLWDVEAGQLRATLQGHIGVVESVAFAPDGLSLASASRDNTIRLWDTKTGQLHSTLQGHTDTVDSVAFAPDGRTLASASADGTIKLWDPEAGQLRATLQGHTRWVSSVAFSPDGRILASAGEDGTKLWEAESSREPDGP